MWMARASLPPIAITLHCVENPNASASTRMATAPYPSWRLRSAYGKRHMRKSEKTNRNEPPASATPPETSRSEVAVASPCCVVYALTTQAIKLTTGSMRSSFSCRVTRDSLPGHTPACFRGTLPV